MRYVIQLTDNVEDNFYENTKTLGQLYLDIVKSIDKKGNVKFLKHNSVTGIVMYKDKTVGIIERRIDHDKNKITLEFICNEI